MATKDSKKPTIKVIEPDQRKITDRQAIHLAKLTKIKIEEISGKKIAEINDKLKWHLDPELLLFRKVCGRVVKRNPTTGEFEPVPNATVHVEDTDCSFFGFFPTESPWSWLFPIKCHREDITSDITDACGHFCVWIPRWDIDRILRFRRERICWPTIFRPRIIDVLEWLRPLPEPPELKRPPRPEPDPLPELIQKPGVLQQISELLGEEIASKLDGLARARAFGESTRQLDALLASPALSPQIAPPLPAKLRIADKKTLQQNLSEVVGLEATDLVNLDLRKWIGPFWRCRDVIIPEWVNIFDVPDITFRVTQDVDGDGEEEIIYSEGIFDVRWNAGDIPDVTLEASVIAHSIPACEGPDISGPCDKPAIRTAGLMTLEPTHHNAATGYAIRPNRPKPGGFSDNPSVSPGEAPYWHTLQLHGCHRFNNAPFYRLTYQYEGGPEVPFLGLHWSTPRLTPGNPPIPVTPDPQGWYEVRTETDLVFPWWLLNWPTHHFSDGEYKVRLQMGNAAKHVIDQSSQVGFMVDNTKPNVVFHEVRWRLAGDPGPGALLPVICPIIERPAGRDIELILRYTASATHFRDVYVSAYNCRAGWLSRTYPGALDRSRYEHWHTTPADNSWTGTAVFSLPGTFGGLSTQGSSSLWVYARGRSFNPAGGDNGPATDWLYNPVYSWRHPHKDIAIIDV